MDNPTMYKSFTKFLRPQSPRIEPEDALNPVDALRKILDLSPGRIPSFTETHALKALELIGNGANIGRQQLSRELRLGEGMIRTLVNRMKGLGLLNTSRGGMTLTPRGKKLLKDINELISSTHFPETEITVGSENYAILVRGAGEDIRKGIEQRDAAMIAGADGATTIIYDGERLLVPGMDMVVGPSTEGYLIENLRPNKGDVIIIGSAKDIFDAEMGAKAAALKLLDETINE